MDIKRRYARWEINKEARLKLQGAEKYCECVVNDISLLGAEITLPMKLPPDTFLQLSLALCEGTEINVEVWVVWHKQIDGHNIYGLYFTKIRDEDKEQIYKFAHKYIPEQVQKRTWEGHIIDTQVQKGGRSMEDRRIFQRFQAKMPVRFLSDAFGKEGSAVTQDISAKGLGVFTREKLTPNMPLELWLEIPDKGEPLYARGNVVWSQRIEDGRYKAGINLEKADLMGLSRVLRAA